MRKQLAAGEDYFRISWRMEIPVRITLRTLKRINQHLNLVQLTFQIENQLSNKCRNRFDFAPQYVYLFNKIN